MKLRFTRRAVHDLAEIAVIAILHVARERGHDDA
jgi:hypothetical protein